MFCTYLTVYRGSKLPLFYIGSTSLTRIQEGYRGSVVSKQFKNIWQNEIKNNPDLFHTVILSTHGTRKEATEKENKLQRALRVVKNPLYINMSYASPNGFTDLDKRGKNNGMFGKTHSNESKRKMSKPRTVTYPKTKEFKQHLRDLLLGKTYEERFGKEKAAEIKSKQSRPKSESHKQNQSKAMKGRYAGVSYEERFGKAKADEIKAAKSKPMSEEQKNVRSKTMKNKPKKMCEYCNKQVSAGNYGKWHGANCKMFTELETLS